MTLHVLNNELPTRDESLRSGSCLDLAGGLSLEQIEVASQMRGVKDEVCRLKTQLNEYESRGNAVGNAEAQVISQKLADLRLRWSGLEVAREEAWKRKMIALGYDV